MGERGVSVLKYGWPYCGYGNLDIPAPEKATTFYRRNSAFPPGLTDGNHDYHFWSYHPELCQFICADGSGHVLSYDIDLPTFQALSTRGRGEIFQLPPGW